MSRIVLQTLAAMLPWAAERRRAQIQWKSKDFLESRGDPEPRRAAALLPIQRSPGAPMESDEHLQDRTLEAGASAPAELGTEAEMTLDRGANLVRTRRMIQMGALIR
jgi:hypothetical protein